MKIIVNGREAGTRDTGCALCGSTWGDYYEEIDGQRLFFCCNLCAKGFTNIAEGIKGAWGPFEVLTIDGSYSTGRHCTAMRGDQRRTFFVRFTDNADIEVFRQEQ